MPEFKKSFVIKNYLVDRVSHLPRKWSNSELKKFCRLFSGKVINVSGWKDYDKEGTYYRDYFVNADEYVISNYSTEQRGFQGDIQGEIFLDLEKELPEHLKNAYDVVFNHTVLEHIFEIRTAFKNLCEMSRDIVIVVVPFLQEQHAEYGDYWRFTPLTLKRLFAENNMTTIYLSYNDSKNSSIYLFAIGAKKPEKWKAIVGKSGNRVTSDDFIGTKIIRNSIVKNIFDFFRSRIRRVLK